MPSDFPGRPRFLKGALVIYESQDAGAPPPKVLTYQYNPETVKRTLERRAVEAKGGGGGTPNKEDLLRAQGPPNETIVMTVTLDASELLEEPEQNQTAVDSGIYPFLSMLEMLLYPSSAKVEQVKDLASQGEVQISPADLPFVLLVWGESRVVPVLITGFTINESGFDVKLNPVTATVELSMKVLTYLELKAGGVGRDAFLAYQQHKERHAASLMPDRNEQSIRDLVAGAKPR
ncbi:MAG TPA: hypothetical protein VEO54_31705 [Thermoanaerobaculia bacterium]|nr:hypothetical protein [Thermoanaerobaculia bacterium]